jgi:hypothetical protein
MFAVAGVAKLLDRGGSRRAVVAFGVPAQIATPVGWALLCAELGIAASLVVGPTARAGAAAATVLLLAFSAAIVANLTRGRTPDCHCFGRLSSGPVGWPNMARNGAFATLAMFIAIGGRLGWLFAGLAITLFGLWVGPTWKRRWAHRIGATAPDFSLADPHGSPTPSIRYWGLAGRSSSCSPKQVAPRTTPCCQMSPDGNTISRNA